MTKYNHAVTIAFTIISDDPQGNDFTPQMIRKALVDRIFDLDQHPQEYIEAVGAPYDTYKEDETLKQRYAMASM